MVVCQVWVKHCLITRLLYSLNFTLSALLRKTADSIFDRTTNVTSGASDKDISATCQVIGLSMTYDGDKEITTIRDRRSGYERFQRSFNAFRMANSKEHEQALLLETVRFRE
ncbi:hypothetical protein WN51_11873 [Melipona quadrifasciata]|uniref:Uncharacterized protein n=1 Tax=Melipona quadrifasciata TaxID=166423 RepID=A0A0N0U625_9HYME|nr:hypothetical protein WN51_11873 [Melipona quadrifasciata]